MGIVTLSIIVETSWDGGLGCNTGLRGGFDFHWDNAFTVVASFVSAFINFLVSEAFALRCLRPGRVRRLGLDVGTVVLTFGIEHEIVATKGLGG